MVAVVAPAVTPALLCCAIPAPFRHSVVHQFLFISTASAEAVVMGAVVRVEAMVAEAMVAEAMEVAGMAAGSGSGKETS